MTPCPCGRGAPYRDCCGRFHRGSDAAARGGPGALHEVSRFFRVAGAWVYVRGRLLPD